MRTKLTDLQKRINKFNRGNFLGCSWDIISGQDLKVKPSSISIEEAPVMDTKTMHGSNTDDWEVAVSDKFAIISGVLTNFDEQNTYNSDVLAFLGKLNLLSEHNLAEFRKVDRQLTVDTEESPAIHADAWEFSVLVKETPVATMDKVIAGKHVSAYQFETLDEDAGTINILFSKDTTNLMLDLLSAKSITKASLPTIINLMNLRLLGEPIGFMLSGDVSGDVLASFVSATVESSGEIKFIYDSAKVTVDFDMIKRVYFAIDNDKSNNTNMVFDLATHGTVYLWV